MHQNNPEVARRLSIILPSSPSGIALKARPALPIDRRYRKYSTGNARSAPRV